MTPTIDDLLTGPDFYQDPYPTYRRLQEESPVHWCEPWQQWIVTRYEDVLQVLRDPSTFSSAGWEQRFLSLLPDGGLDDLRRHYGTSVLSNTDAPQHTRLRRLVSRSFTPKVLNGLRPLVVDLVNDHVHAIRPGVEIDVIEAIAYPLPARVIARMLGAPESALADFERWSADIVNLVGTGSVDPQRASVANDSLRQFRELLTPLIEARRSDPHDDLLATLVEAEPGGEHLGDEEIVATAVTLLFAGHETTANLIANALFSLVRFPDQLGLVRSDPSLIANVVEETLRFESPVQRARRLAQRDTEISGVRIRAGDPVMAFIGAANRDPERFQEAHRFDLQRQTAGQLAFGHGAHFCVGAGLSRIEAPLVLEALLTSFESWEPSWTAPPLFRQNITFRGLEALLLRFD